MIELEKGQLSYVATKVIYNGREYNAPISYSTLIYYDLMELNHKHFLLIKYAKQ
jgi:hypothetical protein